MSAVKITPATSKDFLEANKEAFVVLVFNADFTEQTDLVDKATEALTSSSELKGKIAVGSVDAEANNDLTSEFSVISVPMVVCVKGGKTVKKVDTLEPTKLINTISEQLKLFEVVAGEDTSGQDPKEKFREYLKRLVNRAPVMVFMKGEPNAPRCGFSRQLVELLAKHDIVYETFDILQDEEVRQGLKEYSDWPTYPQIYANGEFIGGLDILKQLDESGELQSTLKVQ